MFDRSKRKSFLFFGATSLDQKHKLPEERNNAMPRVTARNNMSHKPLLKPRLNEKQTDEDDSKDTLTPLRTTDYSGNHYPVAKEGLPMRQSTIGKRRPPPPTDISNIRSSLDQKQSVNAPVPVEAMPTATVVALDESGPPATPFPSSPESDSSSQQSFNTLEHDQISQNITEKKEFHPSHGRNKSEVEQLVDDLDDYISKANLNQSTTSLGDNIHRSSTPESREEEDNSDGSSQNVSPLYGRRPALIDVTDKVPNHWDEDEHQSEADQFSFNGSSNKSMNDTLQYFENNSSHIGSTHSTSSDLQTFPKSSRFIVTNADDLGVRNEDNSESDVATNEYNNFVQSTNTNREADVDIENEQIHENNDTLYDLKNGNEFERRNFRVVNEEKPNFYLNDSTSEDDARSCGRTETNSITTSLERKSSLASSIKAGLLPTTSYNGSHQSSTAQEPTVSSETETIKSPASTVSDSKKSFKSSTNIPDKNVRLISSYVEELRLLYFPTSNSLQLPPDLPYALKNKNSLEQPQNIKVTIRTSTRQVGIKHGKAKQKLLTLETTNEEDEEENGELSGLNNKSESTKVDHTKEFHTLFKKDEKISEADQDILDDIPGDEAYDSDDLMAPLRENPNQRVHDNVSQTRLKRTDTVASYFTRNAARIRSGTLDGSYVPQLPLDTIKYETNDDLIPTPITPVFADKDQLAKNTHSHHSGPPKVAKDDGDYELDATDFGYYQGSEGTGLHITNPDSD